MHNTYIAPVELSWKLGTSGFAVKSGLGIGVPDGTVQGPTGLNNVGNPWWTFQPELIVSYLAGGWNLTAALSDEINTKNSIDDYTSGDIFHGGLHRHQDHRKVDVRSCSLLCRPG